MKHSIFTILFLSISALLLHGALAEQSGIQAGAEQCGIQAGGALCHNNLCCSKWGFCGNTAPYCDDGCQSQCPSPPSPPLPVPPPPSPSPPPPPPSPPPPSPSPPPPLPPSPPSPSGGGVASIISSAVFDQLLMHRNDPTCPARGFYRYEDFIVAANKFVGFGTTGDLITRKREIAAFLAQTSHQTRGKQWVRAPDGRYTWGYCIVEEVAPTSDYCVPSVELPCVPGRKYYGRGPIQLTSNYDYAQAGKYLGLDLLRDPDLVATNRTISFETALWFWMTPQTPTPSCHDVITDNWIPSDLDQLFGRLPGYGVITNIINGRLECWRGHNRNVLIRIGFYKRYCDILGVSVGDYLDCFNQMPFNWPRLSARAEE